LDPHNTNRGFYEFVNKLVLPPNTAISQRNVRIFGEWLVRHKVAYTEYDVFYVFDILDVVKSCWLRPEQVDEYIGELKVGDTNARLRQVPVLYDGQWKDFRDHMREYAGKSGLSAEQDKGEGWVLKRVDVRTAPGSMEMDEKDPHTFKMVVDGFLEVKAPTKADLRKEKEKDKQKDPGLLLAETVVTAPRIEKQIFKLVDGGELPVDWDERQMKVLAQKIPKMTADDCKKEEMATVAKVGEKIFTKYCTNIVMQEVRNMITARFALRVVCLQR
jgi:hypothetical protein